MQKNDTKIYKKGGRILESKLDSLFYKKLGLLLNEKRNQLGYSLRYLSKLTGISRTMLDEYFSGKFRIPINKYNVICEALQLETDIEVNLKIERR